MNLPAPATRLEEELHATAELTLGPQSIVVLQRPIRPAGTPAP